MRSERRSLYAQQRKEARERIAFKGPITPTFIASAKDTFKVKIDKDEINKDDIRRSKRWITRRGYLLTLVLILVWPILSVPAGVFTKDYFAFWVLVSIAWGFGKGFLKSANFFYN